MEYSIKEAAEQLHLSPYTLRYYDKEGLVPFLKRGEKGVRIYTEEDLDWVKMILCLRDIDMPIAKIKEYMELLTRGEETVAQRRILISQYQEYVEAKIRATMECLEITTRKLMKYDSAVVDILNEKKSEGKGI